MPTEAVMAVNGRLGALRAGWRRTTGILRAELEALPLWCWTHPDDVVRLRTALEVARWTPGRARLRLGRLGAWQPVELRLGVWRAGGLPVKAERVGGRLPRGAWWVADYERLPPMPWTPEG